MTATAIFSANRILNLSPASLQAPRKRTRYDAAAQLYKPHARSIVQCSSTHSNQEEQPISNITDNSNATAPTAAANEIVVPQVGWLWDRKSTAAAPRKSLKEQNIRPKKALGQHFMFDESVLTAVTDAAHINPGDLVLEIGPGTGGLTKHLLERGALLTAVEKDYVLHDKLVEEYKDIENFSLVCGDIMRQNIPQLFADMISNSSGMDNKVKIVANLPYNITKECLVATLPLSNQVSSLILMLQDEAGLRLTNKQPGGAEWRAMNIIVQYYSDAKYLFKVDRKRYTPPPQVNGAVVEFKLKPTDQRPAVPEEKFFIKLVKTSFLQRRKLLKNSLGLLFGGTETVEQALIKAELPVDARAQILGLDDFVRLSWALHELLQ